MTESLVSQTILAAIQATARVLLVAGAGVYLARAKVLNDKVAKVLSKKTLPPLSPTQSPVSCPAGL